MKMTQAPFPNKILVKLTVCQVALYLARGCDNEKTPPGPTFAGAGVRNEQVINRCWVASEGKPGVLWEQV